MARQAAGRTAEADDGVALDQGTKAMRGEGVAVPSERPSAVARAARASGAEPRRSLDPERMGVDGSVRPSDPSAVGGRVLQGRSAPCHRRQRGLAAEGAAGRRAARALRTVSVSRAAVIAGGRGGTVL